MSVDPAEPEAGDVFGFNRYAYANNNPFRFTDPDGQQVAGSPNDFANPTTIETSAQLIGWAADGLDAVDQLAMALPQGQFEHAAAVPLITGLKTFAAEARVVNAEVKVARGGESAAAAAGRAAHRELAEKVTG